MIDERLTAADRVKGALLSAQNNLDEGLTAALPADERAWMVRARFERARDSVRVAIAAVAAMGERLAQVEAALSRVRAALDVVPPRDRVELEGAIASNLAAGMSLRACARKEGVGVGVVRGVAKQGRLNQ